MRDERESEYTRADIFNMCDHKRVQSIFHTDTNFDSFYCTECGGIFEDDPSGREEENEDEKENETLGDPEE